MELVSTPYGDHYVISCIKAAVICPHQDKKRRRFLQRFKYYIERQTRQPDELIIVDDQTGMQQDLTKRIKIGIDRAFEAGCNIALVMEDDDWYHPDYIKHTINNWIEFGKPDLVGQGYTDYYHIGVQKYTRLNHPGRASLMSTLINLESIYDFKFPPDDHVFLDVKLWKQLKGKTFIPAKPIAVGIKHGIGNTGGKGHDRNWSMYQKDSDFSVLKALIGKDAEFYEQYFL